MVDEIRDMTGNVRLLGWIAPSPDHLKMRASRTSIQTLRDDANLPPLIPQSDWKPVDFVTGFSINHILNQRDSSGCTGWTAAGALMRQRTMRGHDFVRLSGASVYAQINGGRDQGSNIIDSMHAIESQGACLESEMDYPKLYSSQIPSNATWYKEDVSITFAPSAECATALQMGILPQVPVMVWSGWEQFDGDGVAKTYNKRDHGNHSVYVAGLEYVNGKWLYRLINSWGPDWGPFGDGTCRITAAAIDNCAYAEDSYGHATTLAPQSGSGSGAGVPSPR